MSPGRRPVDYERVARRYQEGRRLSVETIERWRQAVLPSLGADGPGRVVDVGAGTGQFVPVWVTWGASHVVAVEPSPGMRHLGVQAGLPGAFVGGRAERLPLRDDCADVVWMSTVLHQLTDRPASAAEVARILRTGGRWLLRGFFPDRSEIGWLAWFPGAERATAAFPSSTEVIQLARNSGMVFVGAREVMEERNATLGDAASWSRSMRSADTLLCALTDEEVEAGVARMEADAAALCPPNRLSLVTFRLA
jgi:ubiquinone/menaquinone biosynthesis C-methylase UbiE